MDVAKDSDLSLITMISCLAGSSLGFLLIRVSCQVLKRYDLWWNDLILVASWVGLDLIASQNLGESKGHF